MVTQSYLHYWGKAGAVGEFHLLAYHALDVAACGQILISRHTSLRHLLSARLVLDEATLRDWLIFMLALHDIGKFSYRFQCLREDFPALAPDLPPARQYHTRHDTLGAILWSGLLEQTVIERFVAESTPARPMRTALGCWMATAAGHHGQPPKPGLARPEGLFTSADQRAAGAFCIDAGELLLGARRLEVKDAKTFAAAIKPTSWWLAGVAVFCDWLGSNRDLFPFVQEDMSLAAYWTVHALPAAARALEHSGALPVASSRRTQQELFSYVVRPTPLQCLAAELDLAVSPQLLILEDVTGSGKTEAALTAASRILAGSPRSRG